MARRTVALCDGKYIGIETIYTVVNGCQINIPEKLKDLREKSRKNQLFCPCGCGANLILVAGDRNLREQHFRIKDADLYPNCTVVTEGQTSVDSKIVLKCWLDENLQAKDLESRVPICAVSDSSRKYEFTFISREKGIALNYCHDRINLSDEKLQILQDNAQGVSIIHVVDYKNGGTPGQYPEGLMNVQNKQGYCLFLKIDGLDYDKAELSAAFFAQDLDGLWEEVAFAGGPLRAYRIAPDGSVSFGEKTLTDLLQKAKRLFSEAMEEKKRQREEAKKQQQEFLRQQEEQRRLQHEYFQQQQQERERQREEAFRKHEELEAQREKRKEEFYRKIEAMAEQRRQEEELLALERLRREEDFRKNMAANFEQQETQVRDAEGNRWIKCEFCGKIAMESEFPSYGGPGRVNLGICKECYANNPAAKPTFQSRAKEQKKAFDPNFCPICGSRLVERNGRNGRFLGCSGYPKCRYTRSIRP